MGFFRVISRARGGPDTSCLFRREISSADVRMVFGTTTLLASPTDTDSDPLRDVPHQRRRDARKTLSAETSGAVRPFSAVV